MYGNAFFSSALREFVVCTSDPKLVGLVVRAIIAGVEPPEGSGVREIVNYINNPIANREAALKRQRERKQAARIRQRMERQQEADNWRNEVELWRTKYHAAMAAQNPTMAK